MSTNKVTPQKVIAILKKAGKSIHSGGRYNNGYEVRGIYNGYPFVEVDYHDGSSVSRQESYTEAMVAKLNAAANILVEAGLIVLVQLSKEYDYHSMKLYIAKDKEAKISTLMGKTMWFEDRFNAHFAKKIAADKKAYTEEQARKAAQTKVAEDAQAKRMAQVNLLNPVISIDMQYTPNLFVTHVTLMDGRMAVVTVATRIKEEYNWNYNKDTDKPEDKHYEAIDVEIAAVYPARSAIGHWERTTSNLTSGEGDTVEDVIRYWISRQ